MSKIGKKFIVIPDGVQIALVNGMVKVKGPKGEIDLPLHPKVKLELTDKQATVSVGKPEDRRQNALWGTFRSLIENAVVGVAKGFEKRLEVQGVGYKASVAAGKLTLNLGYSHPVEMVVPKGLEAKIEKNIIIVSGFDRQVVGQFAAIVRSQRKPEPYKGKGIRYVGEVVRRKAGKVVKAVGAG